MGACSVANVEAVGGFQSLMVEPNLPNVPICDSRHCTWLEPIRVILRKSVPEQVCPSVGCRNALGTLFFVRVEEIFPILLRNLKLEPPSFTVMLPPDLEDHFFILIKRVSHTVPFS